MTLVVALATETFWEDRDWNCQWAVIDRKKLKNWT